MAGNETSKKERTEYRDVTRDLWSCFLCLHHCVSHRVLGFIVFFFFFQAEDGIRDYKVTGVHVCSSDLSTHARTIFQSGNATRISDLARAGVAAHRYSPARDGRHPPGSQRSFRRRAAPRRRDWRDSAWPARGRSHGGGGLRAGALGAPLRAFFPPLGYRPRTAARDFGVVSRRRAAGPVGAGLLSQSYARGGRALSGRRRPHAGAFWCERGPGVVGQAQFDGNQRGGLFHTPLWARGAGAGSGSALLEDVAAAASTSVDAGA